MTMRVPVARWIATSAPKAVALTAAAAFCTTTAFAAPFGAGAYVAIWNPSANESDSDYFEADPNIGFDGNALLIPESPAYVDGETSAAVSLGRDSNSARASANLATGTLTAAVSGGAPHETMATVGFSDTLTPLADGLQQFDFRITGTNPLSGASIGGIWFAIDDHILWGIRGETEPEPCLNDPGTIDCSYTLFLGVNADQAYKIAWAIQVSSSAGTIDWSHTAGISVSGVPFTSASGIFLTDGNNAPVPEPASSLLLGAGLAALTAIRWQTRRRTTSPG
jgi:hypothetical protein